MENIGFILWMILYPVASSAASYIQSKERKMQGKEPHGTSANSFAAIINIIVWLGVGKALFNS